MLILLKMHVKITCSKAQISIRKFCQIKRTKNVQKEKEKKEGEQS